MKRVLLFVFGALAVGCAAPARWARTSDLPRVELPQPAARAATTPARESGLAAAVDAYLQGADTTKLRLPRSRPVLAPASGGLVGWFTGAVLAWRADLHGHMQSGTDSIDFRNDLGLTHAEYIVVPEVQVSFLGGGMRLAGFASHYSGDGMLNRTFTFGGVNYPVSEAIHSDVRINNVRATYFHSLFHTGFVNIAAQAGVSYLHVDGIVDGSTTGRSEQTADIPVPIVGALVQAKFGRLLLEGDASGFTLDLGSDQGTYVEAQLSVGVTFLKFAAIRGGYRFLYVDVQSGDFRLHGQMQGFFLGASVQF